MPRFQFTIRGLLWVTFWVGVTMAGLLVPKRPIHLWYDQWRNEYSLDPAFVSVVVISMAAISLFGLAIGRHRQAIRIAMISIAFTIALSFLIVIIWGLPYRSGR